MQLPQILSKNTRITRNVSFGKDSPRRELFQVKPYAPSYNPNFNLVLGRDHNFVNMNIKTMREVYQNVDL